MENRQRPPVPGTWDRARYGEIPRYPPARSAPQHGEPHPRDVCPDPCWEIRPPYGAGPPDTALQDEQRALCTDGRGGVPLLGPPYQRGPPRPGAPLPPVPAGLAPDTGPRIPPGPLPRVSDHYGRGPMMPPAPEPPLYNALHHGPALPPQVGRPPLCLPASPLEANSQEAISRLGGPRHVADEHPRYSEGSPHRSDPDSYQPDLFYQGGPGSFRGPDPVLSEYSHSHPSGQQPAGFQHDVPHSEGPQSGGASKAGLYHPNTPTAPNAFSYRPPPTHPEPDAVNYRPPSHTGPDAVNYRPPSHTGPDAVNYRPPSHTGPDTVNYRPPSHTGPDAVNYRPPSHTGPDAGIYRPPSHTGPDAGNYRPPSHTGPDAGNYRPPSHTGPDAVNYRPPSHTGPEASNYRPPSHTGPDAGNYRPPSHSGPEGSNYRPPSHTGPDASNCRPVSHTGPDAGNYMPPSHTGPDAGNYRASSPGSQPAPTQNTPYTETPHQGFCHVPPIHGNPSNPSFAVHPLGGSSGFCESVERDLGVSSVHGHTNIRHLLHQQSPGPLMPPGMIGGRNFEQDAPLLFQHGIPDGCRDPNLLPPQLGGSFVSQPTPYIQDSFMCLDKQEHAMEKGGPEDKDVFVHWLSSFLSCRRKQPPAKTGVIQAHSIAEARGLIYSALRLVSQLDSLCQTLESHDKGGEPWIRDYEKAADIRVDLEKKLRELEKPGYIQGVKRKLDIVHKKRLRCQRGKQAAEEEEKEALERSAEKEAIIDGWRMKCIQKVEEKKRERELKATADGVLGEVRKKQHDIKKMLDVLKSLEKLRKLRKEAAGRKGVCPPPSADETFTNHIKRLRTMVHQRSALYDAEEKTLRVILEGEQEEERQRDKDQRLKKEKEKTLHKQRELDAILFGDTESLPSLHPLQPFRQYYLQAEHSVVSLVQIRHEWDQFLVLPDRPDGSSVPRGWVVPTTPNNDTWDTALKQPE